MNGKIKTANAFYLGWFMIILYGFALMIEPIRPVEVLFGFLLIGLLITAGNYSISKYEDLR